MAPRAILIGPPGAGKSTVGRKLARVLSVPFVDTDNEIESLTGRTIPEIFSENGEQAFRELEEQVVHAAVSESDGVIALGGGAVLSQRTRSVLEGHCVVYLDLTVEEGLRRTRRNRNRPLLAGDAAAREQRYRELMAERQPIYRDVASIRISSVGRSPGSVVKDVVRRLKSEGIATTPKLASKMLRSHSRGIFR